MRGPRIALIAAGKTPHAIAVDDALQQRGVGSCWIDAGDNLNPAPLTVDANGRSAPASVRAALVDLLPAAVPRAFTADGAYWLYEDWYRDWMQAREREALQAAWLLELETSGATLLNSPRAFLAHSKPAQLVALARAKLAVPPFVITSDPKTARAFLRKYRDAVIKPPLGGGYCLPVTAEQIDKIEQLRRAPAILQRRIVGTDVRVTAVASRILSAVAIDSDTLDYRASERYRTGKTRYTPAVLTTAEQQICRTAMRLCGMQIAGIDLKRGHGRTWLLECNGQPGWLAIQASTGNDIAGGIAEHLMALGGARTGMRRRTRTKASGSELTPYSLPHP